MATIVITKPNNNIYSGFKIENDHFFHGDELVYISRDLKNCTTCFDEELIDQD